MLYIDDPVEFVVATNVEDIASTLELAAGETLQGETLEVGDRILLIGQTVQNQNGIYSVRSENSPTSEQSAGEDWEESWYVLHVDKDEVVRDQWAWFHPNHPDGGYFDINLGKTIVLFPVTVTVAGTPTETPPATVSVAPESYTETPPATVPVYP